MRIQYTVHSCRGPILVPELDMKQRFRLGEKRQLDFMLWFPRHLSIRKSVGSWRHDNLFTDCATSEQLFCRATLWRFRHVANVVTFDGCREWGLNESFFLPQPSLLFLLAPYTPHPTPLSPPPFSHPQNDRMEKSVKGRRIRHSPPLPPPPYTLWRIHRPPQ